MGRKKLYNDAADKQRAYRERKKGGPLQARTKKEPGYKRSYRKAPIGFSDLQFLGIDGEGLDLEETPDPREQQDYENWLEYLAYQDSREYWGSFTDLIRWNGYFRVYQAGSYFQDWTNVIPRGWQRKKSGLYPDQMTEMFKSYYPQYRIEDENSLAARLGEFRDWKAQPPVKKPVRSYPYDENITRPRTHVYNLLCASDGTYIENPEGLGMVEIFTWLLGLKKKYPDHIIVGYSLNYDINKWLGDLSQFWLKMLAENDRAHFKAGDWLYKIQWVPNKWFVLSQGKNHGFYPPGEKWRADITLKIFDVFGFFQKSFVASLQEWKVIDPKDIEWIAGMKAQRGEFESEDPARVKEYCIRECKALVTMMEKFRDALGVAGLEIQSWHGAGAIGGHLLKSHKIKEHVEPGLPEEVERAVMGAYFGGRAQAIQIGYFNNIWQHDINSAYPAQAVGLPSLADAYIRKSIEFDPWVIGLYKVKWDISNTEYPEIGPFPWRDDDGSIEYPASGVGWYWGPEVKSALGLFGSKAIQILAGYEFWPRTETKPFDFIPAYYQKRLQLKNSPEEYLRNAQIPVKLGLNSIYGKTAQNTGGFARPPSQSFIYAGLITSGCRAALLEMAYRDPVSIVGFATDGIFSESPLCENDPGKPLGGWEVDYMGEMFLIQSGVYCFPEKGKVKSRGIRSSDIDWNRLIALWEKEGIYLKYSVRTRKFIGLKWAANTGRWDLWGKWPEMKRTITPEMKGFPFWIADRVEVQKVYRAQPWRFGTMESQAFIPGPAGDYRDRERLGKLLILDNVDWEGEE
jgi:hypothetical protein